MHRNGHNKDGVSSRRARTGPSSEARPEANPSQLEQLAARTEELLAELDWERADTLSLTDLNRTLRVLLRGQAAILRGQSALLRGLQSGGLPSGGLPSGGLPSGGLPSGGWEAGGHEARSTSPTPAAKTELAETELERPARLAPSLEVDGLPTTAQVLGLEGGASAPEGETSPPRSESTTLEDGASPETPQIGNALAAELLGVSTTVEGRLARELVAAFDHREQDYDKGLEKLNRWTEGTGGTPFQLRGGRAYLNVGGSSREGVQSYEQNLMKRMGFVRRLGRLVIPGLDGVVVIYERP